MYPATGRGAEQSPIACSLSDVQLRERRDDLAHGLLARCEKVAELADGYEFAFAGEEETAAQIMEFILEERRCCPFFGFELVIKPDNGPIILRLRGRDGVKDFLSDKIGLSGAMGEGLNGDRD